MDRVRRCQKTIYGKGGRASEKRAYFFNQTFVQRSESFRIGDWVIVLFDRSIEGVQCPVKGGPQFGYISSVPERNEVIHLYLADLFGQREINGRFSGGPSIFKIQIF